MVVWSSALWGRDDDITMLGRATARLSGGGFGRLGSIEPIKHQGHILAQGLKNRIGSRESLSGGRFLNRHKYPPPPKREDRLLQAASVRSMTTPVPPGLQAIIRKRLGLPALQNDGSVPTGAAGSAGLRADLTTGIGRVVKSFAGLY
jgi:hypothetical protein